jgi:hypothetical protein
MSTWHQDKRPARLFHETEWTVVENPHNNTQTLCTFARESDAREYCSRVKTLRPNVPAYVLRPAKTVTDCPKLTHSNVKTNL